MSPGASRNSVRSCPTQKPRPAPVRTTARISGSRASFSASPSALCIVAVEGVEDVGAVQRDREDAALAPCLDLGHWCNLGASASPIRALLAVSVCRGLSSPGGWGRRATRRCALDAAFRAGATLAPMADLQLVRAERQDTDQPVAATPLPTDDEALDAYSRVVTTVAERLAPSVANLRVSRRVRGGRRLDGARQRRRHHAGRLHAHFGPRRGADRRHGASHRSSTAASSHFDVVGADPLSDLAVLRLDSDAERRRARRRREPPRRASSWSRSGTRTASPARSRPVSSPRSAARFPSARGEPPGSSRT